MYFLCLYSQRYFDIKTGKRMEMGVPTEKSAVSKGRMVHVAGSELCKARVSNQSTDREHTQYKTHQALVSII